MAALEIKLLTREEKRYEGLSGKYRLVKNERTIDIYEEDISRKMKEIKVRVDNKLPQRILKKELIRYDKRYNNDAYKNDSSCCFVPSIKEAAIEAMVSILTSSINHFAKDANFRASLAHNCLLSLSHDLKSVSDLRRIILSIERRLKFGFNSKDLKKDSLKLFELIHGGYNSQLAACAYLYLGLINKLQSNHKLSAKHLLHVFVYSPFNARINLLPDLWHRLFSPNLSHLKSWFYREVKCLKKRYSKEKKIKIIEKRYNDLVDKGTCDLAIYYLEWLEGEKEPDLNEYEYESSESSSSYPFRHNVLQEKENELILRNMALEIFKLR